MEPTLASAFVAFAEQQLWSLLHYDFGGLFCGDLSIQDGWRAYCAANAAFAETVKGLDVGPGDLIWIHDHPLMMLPGLLRRQLPRARIGFYLHTCFPSTEIFRIFPYRQELLESLLQSSLIGFQAFGYARHLLTASTRLLGVEGSYEKVVLEQRPGHVCYLNVYPLGAGVQTITTILESRAVRRRIAELRERFQNRRIIVGVERLDDRFGGIDLKLAAFEEFLARNPLMRNQCVLVQVAVLEAHGDISRGKASASSDGRALETNMAAKPTSAGALARKETFGTSSLATRDKHQASTGAEGSFHHFTRRNLARTSTDIFADEDGRRQLIRTVCSLVGRINAVYGSLDSSPVHFVNYEPSYEELLALFAVADVCLVSSVRSVMTPVAYEWTLCQHGRGEGPLVLSEFSGAHRWFPSAMLINPYDIEGVAFALQEALSLDAHDRHLRHECAYQFVRHNKIKTWYENFVEDLQVAAAEDRMRSSTPAPSSTSESGFTRSMSPVPPDMAVGTTTNGSMEMSAGPRLGQQSLEIEAVAQRLEHSQKKRLFVLQHDGALMPFQAIAELAGPHPNVLRIVSVLATDPRNVVYLSSGRARRIMTEWYQPYMHKFGFICEFGLYLRAPGSHSIWEVVADNELPDPELWKPLFLPTLRTFADRTPGAIIEEGEHTLVWHFRDADPDFGKWQSLELMEQLGQILRTPEASGFSLEIVAYEAAANSTGGKWVRIGPRGVRKARAVERLLNELSLREFDFVLACGEDRFDEEMFEAIQRRTSMGSIFVRIGRSVAGRSLSTTLQVDSCREWLDALQQVVFRTPGTAPLVSTTAFSPRRQESLPHFAIPSGNDEETKTGASTAVDDETLLYRRSASEPRIGPDASITPTASLHDMQTAVATRSKPSTVSANHPSLPRIGENESHDETEA
jgi:trehalose-phosphatase